MTVTRQVHRKSSSDKQLTLFLVKREIASYIDKVEPIEGVIVFGHDVEKRKIFGQVVVTFRYGREEDEVMGLHFSKDLFLVSEEVYPCGKGQGTLSKVQQKILDKHGPNAVPFRFDISSNTPQTVIIQPGLTDQGQPCGVYYSVKVFYAGEDEKMKPNKLNTVAMSIRKTEIAPVGKGRQPSCIIRKDFLLSPGELELEASLNKPLYVSGEQIAVNLSIRNYSNKSVKKILILVLQNIDISMFTTGNYTVSIMGSESQEGCPVNPGSILNKTFTICPSGEIPGRGAALEIPLPGEEKRLASSTLELVGELPFLLMSRPSKSVIKT